MTDDRKLGWIVSDKNNLAVVAVPVKKHGIVTKFFVVSKKLAEKVIQLAVKVLMTPRDLIRKFKEMRIHFHAVHLSHETKNHVRTITVDGRGLHWTTVKKLVPSPPSASKSMIGRLMNTTKFAKNGGPGEPGGTEGPAQGVKKGKFKNFIRDLKERRRVKKQQKEIKKAQLG